MSNCDGNGGFTLRYVYDEGGSDHLGSVFHDLDSNELKQNEGVGIVVLQELLGRTILIRYG